MNIFIMVIYAHKFIDKYKYESYKKNTFKVNSASHFVELSNEVAIYVRLSFFTIILYSYQRSMIALHYGSQQQMISYRHQPVRLSIYYTVGLSRLLIYSFLHRLMKELNHNARLGFTSSACLD